MVSLYELRYGGPGRLATMAHPPGGPRLAEAMAALAAAGVDVLVSALREDEMTLLELTGEPAAAAAAGIAFVNLPIVDGSVPRPSEAPAVRRLVDRLAGELRAGRFVVTHCRAGVGRCSMLAGATLVHGLGVDPARAWELIRAARGLAVPDNPEQEAWLYRRLVQGRTPADPTSIRQPGGDGLGARLVRGRAPTDPTSIRQPGGDGLGAPPL